MEVRRKMVIGENLHLAGSKTMNRRHAHLRTLNICNHCTSVYGDDRLVRYEALAGKPLPAKRISVLREEKLIEMIGNSRLRATASGAAVLDALVADLAA